MCICASCQTTYFPVKRWAGSFSCTCNNFCPVLLTADMLQSHHRLKTCVSAGLGGMLQGSGEDVLHLVLECLAAVIRVDEEGAQAWEGHITPCVLQLWVHNIADPLLAMEAGGVIQALAAGPAFPNLLVSASHCFPSQAQYIVQRQSTYLADSCWPGTG